MEKPLYVVPEVGTKLFAIHKNFDTTSLSNITFDIIHCKVVSYRFVGGKLKLLLKDINNKTPIFSSEKYLWFRSSQNIINYLSNGEYAVETKPVKLKRSQSSN